MKKIFLMFIAILLINACTNTSVPFNEVESSLNQKYISLSNEYYRMLENPIVERDRRAILSKFESFRTEVRGIKKTRKNPTSNELRVLNSFIDKASINIQYLNHLAEYNS